MKRQARRRWLAVDIVLVMLLAIRLADACWPAKVRAFTGTIGVERWLELIHNPSATVSHGQLVLTLLPNLCPPALGCLPLTTDDIPAANPRVHVPLYPNAAISRRHIDAPIGGYEDTRYLKAAWAEFELPVDSSVAETWYDAQLARLGYSSSVGAATASGYMPDGMAFGVTYARAADPRLILQLGFESLPSGHTLLLYFADAIMPPSRPASSFVRDATAVQITYWHAPASATWDQLRQRRRTIRDPAAIRTLLAIVNALPHDDGGISGGIDDLDYAAVAFHLKDGSTRTLTIRACCRGVSLDHAPPLDDPGNTLWDTIVGLMSGG